MSKIKPSKFGLTEKDFTEIALDLLEYGDCMGDYGKIRLYPSDVEVILRKHSDPKKFKRERDKAMKESNNNFPEVSKKMTRELLRRGFVMKSDYDYDSRYVVRSERCNNMIKKRGKIIRGEVIKRTSENGVNLSKQRIKYTYVPDSNGRFKKGNLDPYRIGEEYLADLIGEFKSRAKQGRQSELAGVAKEIINNHRVVSKKDFKRAVSKPIKIVYANVIKKQKGLSFGKKSTRQFRLFDMGGATPNHYYNFEDKLMDENGLYLLQRDLVVGEMIAALSHGKKKGFGGIGDDFRIFWERYRPEQFDLHVTKYSAEVYQKDLRKEYSFRCNSDEKTLETAVKSSGACLEPEDISLYTWDPGTLNLIGYRGEYPIGYTRLFLTEDGEGKSALALDTMEVGHKEFEKHWDWMRAMGLATMQLGLDLGVKYIFGGDSRVKYGPRQAFGDVYKNKTRLRKIGEEEIERWGITGTMEFDFSKAYPIWEGKTSILFRNWRQNNGKE
jgi:hypothetical protein